MNYTGRSSKFNSQHTES